MIATMVAAAPLTEWLVKRFGHRVTCLISAALLAGSLGGLAWGVSHGYLVVAIFMVTLTLGLRSIMTICGVALVAAMPENRTSIGTALSDTGQELGTSVGTAVVGTLIAALVTKVLPAGVWTHSLVASFFHGESVTFGVIAVIVGIITGWGALSLTGSRETEEAHS